MISSPQLLELAASGGALVLHCALKASIVLVVMSALLLLGRRFSAALRHTLWFLTCLAILVLPVMTVVLPTWQPSFTKPSSRPTTQMSQVVDAGVKTPREPESPDPLLYSLAVGRTKPAALRTPFTSGQIVLALCLGVWLIGAIGTALRYLLGAQALRRVLHRSELVAEGAIAREFQAALRSLGCAKPNFTAARLFIADDANLSVPLTWGALRPIVMLPRTALQWSAACRGAALLHELSHIKRGDWLAQSLASLVSVLYWFHPLVWLAVRQLRLESERATDDRVLATGLAAPDYSSFLMEIVRSMNARHRGSMLNTVPLVGASRLEARLRSVLDPRRNRGPVTRKLAATLALITASALAPLAAVRAADTVAAQDEALNTPQVQRPNTFSRVPTAEEEKKFDAQLSRRMKEHSVLWREHEQRGAKSVQESARLWKIGAYLQNNFIVSDEDVDFVLHLIERGPRVNTYRNRNTLRMYSISSLIPGRILTAAQQERAMKVIGRIAHDPPQDEIGKMVYVSPPSHALTAAQKRRALLVAKLLAHDPLRGKTLKIKGFVPGHETATPQQARVRLLAKSLIDSQNGMQSPAVSIQCTAITFVGSIGSPEATAFLQNLRKTVQVEAAQKRIDECLAYHNAK